MSSDTYELELEQFHAALGACITRWSNVEYELLGLFELCLQRAEFRLVRASFYAVENFRSKFGMVESALSVALKGGSLLQEWSSKGGLPQRLIAKGKIRNTIAHSTIIGIPKGKPGNTVYLRRSLFDPTMPRFIPTRPTNGYFTRDLRAFSEQFLVLSDDLRAFGMKAERPIKQFLRSSAQEQRRLRNPVPKPPKSAKPRRPQKSSPA
jgi:hypothetical protein